MCRSSIPLTSKVIFQMCYSTFRLQFLPKKKTVEDAIRDHFSGVAKKGPIADVIDGWWIPSVVQSKCVGSPEETFHWPMAHPLKVKVAAASKVKSQTPNFVFNVELDGLYAPADKSFMKKSHWSMFFFIMGFDGYVYENMRHVLRPSRLKSVSAEFLFAEITFGLFFTSECLQEGSKVGLSVTRGL
jgi:hypothetical protein